MLRARAPHFQQPGLKGPEGLGLALDQVSYMSSQAGEQRRLEGELETQPNLWPERGHSLWEIKA